MENQLSSATRKLAMYSNLGLYTRRLGSGGRGLVIDKQTQSRTHWLSQAYDVLKSEPACSFCHPAEAA
jgi:hypothetical protein